MLGSPDLPPFFTQTPVTTSPFTHRAPGQCALLLSAGDGAVLVILGKLLALMGKATLLSVAATSFPLLQASSRLCLVILEDLESCRLNWSA